MPGKFCYLSLSILLLAAVSAQASDKPNIVLILADDMGYGDVGVLNPESAIPTKYLDALAAQGITFSDAHTPSSVCTPTRYGLLTGRYCWRTRLKRGVLGGYSPPLIDAKRRTIATMLRDNGYQTVAIGKWHLGMSMASRDKKSVDDRWDGDGGVDFKRPIADGPTTRGFDAYFGVSASLDMAPYVWIKNDRFVSVPTKQFPGKGFPAFSRKGPIAEDFVFEEGLDRLASEASEYISSHANDDKPFFLYMPLTGPHKPVSPHERFVGATELGPYGDFVVNVDAAVGQVLQALDDAKITEQTLVVYTSDNGSFMYRYDEPEKADHVDDETIQGYRPEHHRANGPLRGTKADIWEAGHRVPFFARWPGQIKPGSRCEKPICLTDLFATLAEIAGVEPAENEAEDSFSLRPLLAGQDWTIPRAPIIHHSSGGMFAIRDGKWKLVAGNGSGGRQAPKGKPFARPFHLYDLSADLAESNNLIDKQAAVADRLEHELDQIRQNGRSRK